MKDDCITIALPAYGGPDVQVVRQEEIDTEIIVEARYRAPRFSRSPLWPVDA